MQCLEQMKDFFVIFFQKNYRFMAKKENSSFLHFFAIPMKSLAQKYHFIFIIAKHDTFSVC